MNSDTFAQLVTSITDYNRKISTARKTLEVIHTSFNDGMKTELQKLSQYAQDLRVTQTHSEGTSESEVAKYHALVSTTKRQVEEAERAIAERQASYRICKIEQDENTEKWGIEIGRANRQLLILLDF